ncbi:hypothetical protein ACVMGC_003530 [Bradyrhizobium barranii subsp. barranii]
MIKPVAPTLMDRFLAGVAPNFATRRYHARLSLNYMGQYAGVFRHGIRTPFSG